MIITSIEPQKKREDRFNVYVDGQFAFAASAQTIFQHGLKADKDISQETVDTLVKENEYGLLLDKTLRYLASRPHSEKELLGYFKRPTKSTAPKSEQAIEMVIAKVKDLGYVNDEEFARWYIESRTRSRPRGKRLLKLELLQKGIAKEIVESLLEQSELGVEPLSSLSPESRVSPTEEELAVRVAEKKISSYKNLERREFYQKMGAYLARRGFDWDTIKPVIDQLWQKR